MGADVVMVSIACVCEKGNLWKTALKDDEDRPAVFALVYAYGKNIIYFVATVQVVVRFLNTLM